MIAMEFCRQQTTDYAERELASFLYAISQTFGSHKVEEAGALWIQMLDAADQIDDSPHRVFRRITIRVIAELTARANPRVQSWPAIVNMTPQGLGKDSYDHAQGAFYLAS
jgi:hypothetical protein